MKLLYIALIILTGCDASQMGQPQSIEQRSASPIASCSLSIMGTYQNVADGITMTISNRGQECGIQLSCGFTGYVYSQGSNNFIMIADAASGDTWLGCGLPAMSTQYSGKSGMYATFNFQLVGSQWLGYMIPSEVNASHGNEWSKL